MLILHAYSSSGDNFIFTSVCVISLCAVRQTWGTKRMLFWEVRIPKKKQRKKHTSALRGKENSHDRDRNRGNRTTREQRGYRYLPSAPLSNNRTGEGDRSDCWQRKWYWIISAHQTQEHKVEVCSVYSVVELMVLTEASMHNRHLFTKVQVLLITLVVYLLSVPVSHDSEPTWTPQSWKWSS